MSCVGRGSKLATVILMGVAVTACSSSATSPPTAESACTRTSGTVHVVGSGEPPSGGLTANAAEDSAVAMAATCSTKHVVFEHFCLGRLHDIDPGAVPGIGEPLDAWVYQILLRGRFPPISCGPAPLP